MNEPIAFVDFNKDILDTPWSVEIKRGMIEARFAFLNHAQRWVAWASRSVVLSPNAVKEIERCKKGAYATR